MYRNIINIRDLFINFFKKKGHFLIKSSSLIPDDNSLLFTNAGMNQFKDIFLGLKKIEKKKIVTSQRCLRIGGKHNDFDNVGYTFRHNTFFEMVGNFSFDSYFKEEAILYAWELLTDNNYYFLSKDNFIVTVHINDKESYNIWSNIIGLSKEKIFKVGDFRKDIDLNSDNFWRMSKFGPCGYSTEIYYNINNYLDISNFLIYKDSNKYLEIWNLVFIEYNLSFNGEISLLPYKSVDTGMGLERISSIIQNVNSIFLIDIFLEIKKKISDFLKIKINFDNFFIFNIISDHIRSVVHLIVDGVLPSNEHRGYVLRKIIRRILVNLRFLKIYDLILYKLFFNLRNIFKYFYFIKENKFLFIKDVVFEEEKKFFKTLNSGLKILNFFLKKKKINKNLLKGDLVFYFYDTYGLSLDIIKDFCNFNNIKIDIEGFKKLLLKQKKRSRIKSIFKYNCLNILSIKKFNRTKFLGYNLKSCVGKILYIFKDNVNLDFVNKDSSLKNNLYILLDYTVLYPESGGQKGDKGLLIGSNNSFKFIVNNTKIFGDYIFHIGRLDFGVLKLGDIVNIYYDIDRRKYLSCNHSSTHILYFCIKKILGNNILKCGSSIKKDYFTFDFNYDKNLTKNEVFKITNLVNKYIFKGLNFIEEYRYIKNINNKFNFLKHRNITRIVKFGDSISEKCCGTHVSNTLDIGFFVIFKIKNISSNVKRIIACTNINAIKNIVDYYFILFDISNLLSDKILNLNNKLFYIFNKNKLLKNKYNFMIYSFLNVIINNININNIINYNGFNFLVKKISNLDILNKEFLFILLNKLKIKYNLSIIVFLTLFKNKEYLVIFFNKNIKNKINYIVLESFFLYFFEKKNVINNNGFFVCFFFKKKKKIFIYKIVNFIKKKILYFFDKQI